MGLWKKKERILGTQTQHGKMKAHGSPLYCKARRVGVYAREAIPILKMIYFAILLNILCI